MGQSLTFFFSLFTCIDYEATRKKKTLSRLHSVKSNKQYKTVLSGKHDIIAIKSDRVALSCGASCQN